MIAINETVYDGRHPGVLTTEVLAPNDNRSLSPEFNDAKQKGIEVLIDKGAFEILLKEDLPEGANVLGGRSVLAIKTWERTKSFVNQYLPYRVTWTGKRIYWYTRQLT